MELTRVDSIKLAAAAEAATRHLNAAIAALEPLLTALNEADRATTLRPPVRFLEAGREMVRAAALAPALAETADFDATAVAEDLDNVALLAPVAQNLERLKALLDDSRLVWLAEAYAPSLALYRVCKEAQKSTPKLAPIVTPLADVFASRRKTRAAAADQVG
ncbi:MAG: hypothetical protein ABMB14_02440 [Myxococcota bacterium]